MMSTITLRIMNRAAAPTPSTSPSPSSSPLSLLLLLLLLSSLACSTSAFSRPAVTFLPRFHGPLPFHLETGYVGVGESEGVQLFYYFLKSDRNPKQDPLILWLTGGHGCSALSALLFEIGNENSIEPSINLQGCLLGNPLTDVDIDNNHKIPFAHGMGLISDELYESLKSSCGGEYHNVDTRNKMCARYIAEYEKCVSGIKPTHILEPKCSFISPKPQRFSDRRSLNEIVETLLPSDSQSSLPTIRCRIYNGLLAQYWANDGSVRKALGIRQGTIWKWVRCIGTPYTKEIKSSVPFHVNLSVKGYVRSYIVWIRSLNYSIVDEWRPWSVQGQVVGYTRTYSNGMTYATVKGGGHTAPEYKPKECFAMFERWISQNPL